MSDINSTYEDEIALIDIFRVLWKWKLLIFFGTMVITVVAVLYSFQLQKQYKSEMIIQPGVLKVSASGERVYINSLKNIVGRIDAGIYDNAIILNVLKPKDKETPESLLFECKVPADSNVLKIAYETIDLKEGSAVLNYLFSIISKEEEELLAGVIHNYNHRITLNKLALEKSNTLIKSYEKNISAITKRIKESHKDIKEMEANSSYLSYERKKLLEKKVGANDSLSALLYSNTIQQSIQFVNIVKKDLSGYHRLKEAESQKIITEKDKQQKILQDNNNLIKERDSIVKMKILIPPENSSVVPIKPNKKIIVMLSFVAGMFFCIFLSFIIEYIKNNTRIEKE